MTEHEHERLLESVLSGELAADDPRVQAACADDAAFRSELRSLQEAQAILNRAGDEERAVLDEVKVAAAQTPQKAPRNLAWIALLAAALLVSLLIWSPWSSTPVTRFLGGDVAITAPNESGEPFGIEFSLPAGGYYEIRVTDAGTPPKVIEAVPEHRAPTWQPQVDWPAVVVIEISAYTPSGDFLASGRMRFVR